MTTKKEQLNAKLESWTDQASLTKGQPTVPTEAAPLAEDLPHRTVYTTERGLLDRIDAAAEQGALSQSQVIGQLLTWALDQVDAGLHRLA